MEEKKISNLWTKDFSILTIGSFISLCGNNIAGFALGLLILDYTKSTFLYAIYMASYTLPMIFMPILAGPYLDKFSRKKAICILDFISAFVYALLALMLFKNIFNFPILIVCCLFLGSISSVYKTAYESFFPLLITEGNFQKAYSISSMLETMAALMVPVSAFLYNLIGIVPLFIINMITFLFAAIAETQIKAREEYCETENGKEIFTGKHFWEDLKEGIVYLNSEKGLLAIALYFLFYNIAGGAANVIELPYFKANYPNGEYTYMYVWGFALLGRMIGGSWHYRFKMQQKNRFKMVLVIYLVIALISGTYLYTPLRTMMILCFITGILGITSYSLRLSSTQSYVPNEKKGRFSGAFLFMETIGILVGQLSAGALSNVIPERRVLFVFMVVSVVALFVIMGRYRKEASFIYNRER